MSLISRKKVGGQTVYNEIKKKKKDTKEFHVDGNNLPIHDKKKFASDNTPVSFGQFCQMFGKGDNPDSIDEDFNDYLAY